MGYNVLISKTARRTLENLQEKDGQGWRLRNFTREIQRYTGFVLEKIEAIYEDGVFKPLERVELEDKVNKKDLKRMAEGWMKGGSLFRRILFDTF